MPRFHQFHIDLANIIEPIIPQDWAGDPCCIISNDCGGKHALPIWHEKEDGNAIPYAEADLLIIKNGEVKAQVEIEEQEHSPTKLFGKLLATSKCSYCQYKRGKDGPIEFAKDFIFIQIVRPIDAIRPENSKKPEQSESVRKDILKMDLKSISGRNIEYHLLDGSREKIANDTRSILESMISN